VNGLFLLIALLLSPALWPGLLTSRRPSPAVCATSTVGICARRAASPLWVAPRPGVGSVAAFSYEGFLMLKSE